MLEDDLRALYAAPVGAPALERAVLDAICARTRARRRLCAWQGALLLATAVGSAATGAYAARAARSVDGMASGTPLAPASLLAAG